jgi:ABC-type transport system involved in multi-copper enzyme maturation permease subunit
MRNLMRHLVARHGVFLLTSLLLLAGFQFLICAVVSTIDVTGALAQLMQRLPPVVRSTVGEQFFAGLSVRGILAFGWSHPVALALGAAMAILLAARAVAGEIEHGMMELWLSQPLGRRRYLSAQVLFALSALALLALAGVAGTELGQRVYGLEPFAPAELAKLALSFFLLHAAWFGIALVLSVLGQEGGRAASTGFLLAVTSYLVETIGRLWPRAAFLLPVSPHHYYAPQSILVHGVLAARSVAVLALLLVAGVGVAAWRFERRDIP